MTETLYIRLTSDAESCSWAVLDEERRLVSSAAHDSLDNLAESASGRRVVVLVPGIDVVVARPELPAAQPSRLRQMVPFALEDALAQDVDRLFFAVGRRDGDGCVNVSVVTRERMGAWIAMLGANGLTADAVFADMEGVPEIPGSLTLVAEDRCIAGRRSGQAPFVLEDITIADLLQLSETGDESPDSRRVLVYAEQAVAARCSDELTAVREQGYEVEFNLLADGVTVMLARNLAAEPGTNLLQGAYARKSDWVGMLKPWRVAASLLGAALLLAFVAQATQYISLAREDRELNAQLEQACQRQFGATSLRACETESRRALEAMGESPAGVGGETFLSMVAAVAIARPAGSVVDGMSFRSGILDLQLSAPTIPALDEFSRRIETERPLEARIQSTRPGDSGVDGRIQIVATGL